MGLWSLGVNIKEDLVNGKNQSQRKDTLKSTFY